MVSTEKNLKKNMRKTPMALRVYPYQLCRLNEGDTIIEIHISDKFISKNEF